MASTTITPLVVALARFITYCVSGCLIASKDHPNEISDLQSELNELQTAFGMLLTELFSMSDLTPIRMYATTRVVRITTRVLRTVGSLDSCLYHISKAENNGGDHWLWIRKKSKIERLRRLRISINHDLELLILSANRHSVANETHERHNHLAISVPRECGPSLGLSNSPDRSDSYPQAEWGRFLHFYRQAEAQARIHNIAAQSRLRPRTTVCSPSFEHYWEAYPEQALLHHQSSAIHRPVIPGKIPICYVLIFLGFLTIVGSLVPALWRSISRNDISGGFSLAQYILGVGVFVIGCAVAIHSRTCTCWSSSSRAISPTQGSSFGLEAVDNIGNTESYELAG